MLYFLSKGKMLFIGIAVVFGGGVGISVVAGVRVFTSRILVRKGWSRSSSSSYIQIFSAAACGGA